MRRLWRQPFYILYTGAYRYQADAKKFLFFFFFSRKCSGTGGTGGGINDALPTLTVALRHAKGSERSATMSKFMPERIFVRNLTGIRSHSHQAMWMRRRCRLLGLLGKYSFYLVYALFAARTMPMMKVVVMKGSGGGGGEDVDSRARVNSSVASVVTGTSKMSHG